MLATTKIAGAVLLAALVSEPVPDFDVRIDFAPDVAVEVRNDGGQFTLEWAGGNWPPMNADQPRWKSAQNFSCAFAEAAAMESMGLIR